MSRLTVYLGLSALFLFASGCDMLGLGGGTSDPRPPGGEDYTFAKEAEVVDVGKVSVSEKTSSQIVLQTSGKNLDLEKGEVIVSKVPEEKLDTAPRFLRKVESVKKQGGEIIVSTSQAALVDAVKKASLDLSTSLSGKSKAKSGRTWRVTSVAKGVTVKSCDAVNIENVALSPEDEALQVALKNGKVSFCPDIDGSINISGFSLQKFSTTASGKLTYNTDITASASASVDLSNSVELATFETYGIAGPVQYTMEVSLVAGYEATAGGSVNMKTGIESSGSLKLGARYKNGDWSSVSSKDLSFNSRPVEWGREAGATVRGYIRPEIKVFIYDTVAPTLFVGPYVELAAKKSENIVTNDYKYGAFGGLNGGVGYDIEIISFGISEYEKPIFDLRTKITGVGPTNPSPDKPSSPQPSDGSKTSGTNPTLSWDASDPDSDNLRYDVLFGTSSSPSLAASDLSSKSYDPGSLQNGTTYYWKVKVTDQDGASAEGPVWSFTTPSGSGGDAPQEGLVAYYPFNGNANDASGNGIDGTAKGDATLTTDRFGDNEKAYLFDGDDDYIVTEQSAHLQIDKKFTFSAWILVNNFDDYSRMKISAQGTDVDQTGNWQVGILQSGNLHLSKNNVTGVESDGAVDFKEWHHVVVTFSNGNTKFYVDGNLDSEKSLGDSSFNTTSDGIKIGGPEWLGSRADFDGKIDEVRIYNRALSDSEVQDLYNAEK